MFENGVEASSKPYLMQAIHMESSLCFVALKYFLFFRIEEKGNVLKGGSCLHNSTTSFGTLE
jgi:hypothetical protein